MGVKSLQSFLKNNEAYFSEKIVLKDTTLIIDANNLICQIYSTLVQDPSSPHFRNDVYGGDFVQYAKTVREFFSSLKKCNIVPILVFDGSVIGKASLRDFVASKERETYQRGLKKFQRSQNVQEFPDDDEILLPQLLGKEFRTVASELNLKRVQTAYEADTHIARLANENNCPVLTNDSDFIIYALKRGFILLDWLEYHRPVCIRSGRWGINCNLFSQHKLLKSIPGLSPKCLPLVSVILGNDYVEADTFDQVVAAICNLSYDGFLEARSFNHRRIANLLIWLRRRSLDEAMDYILNLVHANRREKLKRLLKMLMRSYNIEESDDLDKELDSIYSPERKITDKTELQPTVYLRALLEESDVSSVALDMIFHNTHYNYTTVDDFRLPSSGYVKYRPYSLAIVLLRPQSYTNLTTYQRKILSEKDSFYLFDRLNGEYTKLIVRPMEKLENFGSLEHLDCHTMILLEPTLKKSILLSCFHTNAIEIDLLSDTIRHVFDGTFVAQACVCMMLTKYIGIETRMPPKPQFVDSLMLTLFFYAACSGALNKVNFPDPSKYGHLLLKLRSHTIMVNKHNYGPYEKDIFRRIVHFISQLLSAFKGYLVVNALLDHPFHKTETGLFLNCTLIYRLTKLFRFGQEKLDDLCRDIPLVMEICDSVRLLVRCQ